MQDAITISEGFSLTLSKRELRAVLRKSEKREKGRETRGKIGTDSERVRRGERKREKRDVKIGDRRQEPVSPHFHEKRRELLFSRERSELSMRFLGSYKQPTTVLSRSITG